MVSNNQMMKLGWNDDDEEEEQGGGTDFDTDDSDGILMIAFWFTFVVRFDWSIFLYIS